MSTVKKFAVPDASRIKWRFEYSAFIKSMTPDRTTFHHLAVTFIKGLPHLLLAPLLTFLSALLTPFLGAKTNRRRIHSLLHFLQRELSPRQLSRKVENYIFCDNIQ